MRQPCRTTVRQQQRSNSRGSRRGTGGGLGSSGEEEEGSDDANDEEGRSPEKSDLGPLQKKQRKRLSNGNRFATFLEGAQADQQGMIKLLQACWLPLPRVVLRRRLPPPPTDTPAPLRCVRAGINSSGCRCREARAEIPGGGAIDQAAGGGQRGVPLGGATSGGATADADDATTPPAAATTATTTDANAAAAHANDANDDGVFRQPTRGGAAAGLIGASGRDKNEQERINITAPLQPWCPDKGEAAAPAL